MKTGKVTPDKSSTQAEALPLGWTQIKRGKKRRKVSSGADESCCDDPTCSNENETTEACPTSANKNLEGIVGGNDNPQAVSVELKGKALFCLHSLDCSWFQGQFINARNSVTLGGSSVNSLGLLATQREDLDDCLQCSDGGYREIDLTLSVREKGPKLCVERLPCTGGDMLQIRTPLEEGSNGTVKVRDTNVTFDADQIITGQRVGPLVRTYFSSLLTNHDVCVLEQLPDCAIVVGDMNITVPKSFLNKKPDIVVNIKGDDDWLE